MVEGNYCIMPTLAMQLGPSEPPQSLFAPESADHSPSPRGEGRGEGEVSDPARARVPRFVHRFPLTLTLSLREREPAADDAVSPDNGPAIPDFKQPKSRTNHSPAPGGEGRGERERDVRTAKIIRMTAASRPNPPRLNQLALCVLLTLSALLSLPALAQNTALIPAPRNFPTNWLARHEGYVAEAKKGGVKVLFLGDSITDGWRWDTGGRKIWAGTFAPLHAANFGIGYDRIQNVLWRVENGELDGISPQVVVLLIGTNNSGYEDNGRPRNTTPEIIAGVSNLVRRIQFHLPAAKIILFGLFPRGQKDDPIRAQVRDVNAGLAQLAEGDRVKFLDIGGKFLEPDGTLPRTMFPDLLHPNETGYKIWADALLPELTGALK